MELTQEQQDACSVIISRPGESSLAGPAGSGKTTLLKTIAADLNLVYGATDEYGNGIAGGVVVCTPTNKAAQVLRSKDVTASTIHKVFFVPETVETRNAAGKVVSRWVKFTPCNEYPGRLPEGKLAFANVIIVDEASMVQTWMIAKLRRMCDRLILIGDPHQLPPVKDKAVPGGYFNTLDHDAELVQIHRQKEGSDILGLATAIRTESPKVVSYINSFRPEMNFEDAVDQGFQFIAFTNKERARINMLVRRLQGRVGVLPEPGDRMISFDNASDTVLNGTTMTCLEFYDWAPDEDGRYPPLARMRYELDDGTVEDRHIAMDKFMGDQLASQTKGYVIKDRADDEAAGLSLTYAYCMTAHKAQGSEYDKVAVIDQRNVIKMMTDAAAARGELTLPGDEVARRWIYTAVTRARNELVIAGQWWATLQVEGMAA